MNYPDPKYTCCFTGHRFLSNEHKKAVKAQLPLVIKTLLAEGITNFVTGGALGFDTLAAEAVLELKREAPQIRLITVIPCRDQHLKWKAADRHRYEHILSVADELICLNDKYCTGCMHQRNKLLVSLSSICVAYCTGKSGGTFYTLNLAREHGLRSINLATQIDT